jgi:hypothetical protein
MATQLDRLLLSNKESYVEADIAFTYSVRRETEHCIDVFHHDTPYN